jgi:hypothetical protein
VDQFVDRRFRPQLVQIAWSAASQPHWKWTEPWGLDKSGIKGSTAFNGIWEPWLNAQGRNEIVLQDEGLTSEYEAYATILHEIIHTSNPVAGEADVESLAVGIAEEGYIR